MDPESDSAVAGTDVTVWVTTEPPTVTTVTCVVGVEVLVEDEVDSSEEVDEDEVVAAALEEVDDSDEDVDVDDVEAFVLVGDFVEVLEAVDAPLVPEAAKSNLM